MNFKRIRFNRNFGNEKKLKAKLFLIFSIFICLATLTSAKDGFADGSPGSSNSPLRVMLVPTDGGTEEGTKRISHQFSTLLDN